MPTPAVHRTWLCCLAGLFLLGLMPVRALRAETAAPAARNFHLPGGDARVMLKRFIEQSGEQVFYFVDAVRGVTTQPVEGTFVSRTALEHMLEGTPLRVMEDAQTGALTVRRFLQKPVR